MKYEGKLKRAFDIAAGTIFVTALAIPMTPIIAFNAAYLRENPFYLVDRIGKDKQIFKMIKLKSMRTLNDSQGNPLPDDTRQTKFGTFLKHTGLDELPQLINVIKGDMSLVGPRPMSQNDYNKVPDNYKKFISSVRPGMTGPWQVYAINHKTTGEERFLKDAIYARSKITFTKDLLYMFRTIPSFWKGHDKQPPKNQL